MHSIIKLLTLNIKTMKREDLKLGEYYVYDKRQVLIFKGIKVNTKVLDLETKSFTTQNYSYNLDDIRHATPEEKHWLDVCINKDTFVPREIAMVTFKSKEIDFIYGEWYKSNHNNGGRWFYLKALRSMTGVGKRVEGEGISSAGYYNRDTYYYNRDTYWNLEDAINQALKLGPMTDLTEIQEFLPAGHIDKIDKIVKNTSNRVILCTTKDEWDDLCDSKIAQSSKVQKNWFYSSPKYMYIDEGLHGEGLPSSDYYVYTYSEFKKKYDTPSAEAKTILLQDVKADQYYYAEYEEERCRAHGTYMSKERAKELGIKEVTIPHQSVFLKDDYIVTLQEVSSSFPKNHIFKQRETTDYLRVYKDIRGEANGNTIAKFTKTSLWRYATKQEIMEYDIQDRPVDVTRIGMAPDKWCVEVNMNDPDRKLIMDYLRELDSRSTFTGTGGMYYMLDGSARCATYKPEGYHQLTHEQFKRDIMKVFTDGVPHGGVSTPPDTLPEAWYMIVDQENILDAEIWRWDGNDIDARLEIGQLIGVPKYGGKRHNPGKSTEQFGTQINYNLFKKHVLTKERKAAMITKAFPIGSCVVVTKGSYGKNGKENHCYKVIEHTGIGTGDISLKYQSCNSIGLSHVRVRSATASETTRYQREGKPYDVTSLDTLIHESSNTETDPYAGKSLEEMLVICRKMFPKGCKYKTLKGDGFPGVYTLEEELVIQGMGTSNEGISRIGLPWFFYKGEILCERVDDYNAEITPHGQPTKDASKEEILAYCKKMYPKGTVIQGGYVVTKELIWEGSGFISHAGLGIVYNQRDHSFANILSFTHVQEPTKTLEDLPKKAKMSDVSALVKHQEPVVAFSKKAKRSKLVIINK